MPLMESLTGTIAEQGEWLEQHPACYYCCHSYHVRRQPERYDGELPNNRDDR